MTTRATFLLIFLGGLLLGCTQQTSPKRQEHPVTLAQASAAMPTETAVHYTATVVPDQQVDLSFKSGGYIASIAERHSAAGGSRAVDAGDLVHKGELLARLDVPELRSQVKQAGASVSGTWAAREASEAQLKQARSDAQRTEDDWGRAQRLYAQAAITKPDYDAAKNKQQMAQSQVIQATSALASQVSRIQASEAQRTEAKALLGETELRSPFKGVVLSRDITVGGLAASGMRAFTLAEIDKVKILFLVPDRKVGTIHPGDKLPVFCDALSPESLVGTVTAVAASADQQSSTFRVEVTLLNPDHRIRPGMIASVAVPTVSKGGSEVATVPLAALVHRPEIPGGYGIFTVTTEGNRSIAHLQSVQAGSIEGDKVAILNGIREGTPIVVEGSSDLLDGQSVVDANQGVRQ